MHARALFRLLEAAIATTTLGGCCIFGRSYGPSERTSLLPANESVVASARPDSSLPKDVCKDICGPWIAESNETLLGCWVATLESGPVVKKRYLLWEYPYSERGGWLKNSVVVPDDLDISTLDPDHLDPAICAGHTAKDTPIRNCHLSPAPPPAPPIGTVLVECRKERAGGCDMSFGSGRDTRARATAIAGSWFVRAAMAERTSVRAFAEMADELRAFGAPPALVRGARRARRDEIRHARVMARLSRTRIAPLAFRRTKPRSLGAFARENAIEGCVRELFGAAVLLHQSRHAAPALRPVFAAIARDETRHAALSLRIHAWCKLRHVSEDAIATLLDGWETPDSALGLPTRDEAEAIVARLRAEIWAPLGSKRWTRS